MVTSFFRSITAIFWLSLTLSVANAQPESTNPLYQQTSEVNNIMVQYRADYGNVSRFYTIRNSPERRERLKAIVQQYSSQLQQLPFEKLNTGTKVDYILFNRDLNEELYQLNLEEKEYNSIRQWVPFADSIYALEKARRRGAVPNAAAIAGQLNEYAKTIQKLQQQFAKETAISIEAGRRAEGAIAGLQDALKSVFEFYNGYDPLFSWWVPQPYHVVDSLLGSYAKTIQSKEKSKTPQVADSSGIVGNPIGDAELRRRLQYEMIAYTPDELVAIANKEFAWCDAEMLKASREMGLGDNWKAALEKVKMAYVPPGQQPAAMLELYNHSVDFIERNGLMQFSPLVKETWRMRMMTAKQQKLNPFFTGGEEFSISYPTAEMSQEDKLMSMRGNNPHFSYGTVQHELLAGHALQEFSTNRYKTYRHFETPFWIEGWALYWEMLLWDKGFAQKPEDKVGMLFWRMHRCARIIFSLNYHTGKWTPQQCIDFLVNRVGHEKANAEGEVRRSFVGGYDPLYQIAYMIGGLQIMALKRELVDGGKMSFDQFHHVFMEQNMMPIEMERAILTNQPPAKDFKASWKFYKF